MLCPAGNIDRRRMALDGAELVIKMQGRHLDGDVGDGGWTRRAPSRHRRRIRWHLFVAGGTVTVDGGYLAI